MANNKCTFEDIRKENLLLYEYIRGSQAYGTSLPKDANINAVSDIDTAGVFIIPKDKFYGLNEFYQDTIADERNDNVWNELGKWFSLIINSNPNVLESLWIPERCILYESEAIKEIKKNRDIFLSKEVYNTFGGYARSQVKKMRGLNKAIVNPVTEKLTPLDFIYTFYKQGSTKIKNWLAYRGLKQRYCGLVNIPNMHNTYGLYYDLSTHLEVEYGGKDNFIKKLFEMDSEELSSNYYGYKDELISSEYLSPEELLFAFIVNKLSLDASEIIYDLRYYPTDFERFKLNFGSLYDVPSLGYRGIINVEETSNELRLANVPKGETPLCFVAYNVYGYTKHCSDYKRYNDWVKYRNPNRYELNKESQYDLKNCYHMFRLIHMATEILSGKGVFIDRTGIDSDFLLKVRTGEFSYDEICKMMDEASNEMEEAYRNTSLPDKINIDDVNNLLIDVRKKIYGKL